MDSAVACYTGGPGSIPAMSECSLGYKLVGKNGASHDNWRDLASPCSYKKNPSHATQAAKLGVSARIGRKKEKKKKNRSLFNLIIKEYFSHIKLHWELNHSFPDVYVRLGN